LVHPLRLAVGPGMQLGPRQSTPPDLVLEAEHPVGVPLGQADQAVARPFFRRYAGSGLVIHRLARFQPIPIRINAWRIDSRRIAKSLFECSDESERLPNFSAQVIGAGSNRQIVG
jgi:hypothetical protein